MPASPAYSYAYLQFTKQQTVIRHWTTAAVSNAVPGGTQNDLISNECSVLCRSWQHDAAFELYSPPMPWCAGVWNAFGVTVVRTRIGRYRWWLGDSSSTWQLQRTRLYDQMSSFAVWCFHHFPGRPDHWNVFSCSPCCVLAARSHLLLMQTSLIIQTWQRRNSSTAAKVITVR